MSYRNFADGSRDQRPFSLCACAIRINSPKTVKSLTLPNHPDVLALAATLLERPMPDCVRRISGLWTRALSYLDKL